MILAYFPLDSTHTCHTIVNKTVLPNLRFCFDGGNWNNAISGFSGTVEAVVVIIIVISNFVLFVVYCIKTFPIAQNNPNTDSATR